MEGLGNLLEASICKNLVYSVLCKGIMWGLVYLFLGGGISLEASSNT
jgi:hypothetical protein